MKTVLMLPILGALVGAAVQAAGKDQPQTETTAGWVKYAKNPVLGGDLGTCFDVSVLREGEAYRMWFSWRPKKSIALVESKDGIQWSKPEIVIGPNDKTNWEDDLNRPVVIKTGNGYQMWYTGQVRAASRGLAMPQARTGSRGSVRATSLFSQRNCLGKRSP